MTVVGVQSRLGLDVSVEHVKNPRAINGDEAVVKELQTKVPNHFSDIDDSRIQQLFREIKSPPLDLDKCLALRGLIDKMCIVVPNEVNQQDDLIMITKVITVGLNEIENIRALNLHTGNSLNSVEVDRTEIKRLAVAQLASDALDRYIEKMRQQAAPRASTSMVATRMFTPKSVPTKPALLTYNKPRTETKPLLQKDRYCSCTIL